MPSAAGKPWRKLKPVLPVAFSYLQLEVFPNTFPLSPSL